MRKSGRTKVTPSNGEPIGVAMNTRARWRSALKGHCENPDCRGRRGRLRQHHVVYEQVVIREGGDKNDPANSITLCDGCHEAHHAAGPGKLKLTAIPTAAVEFAFRLLGARAYDLLKRRYAGEDPRLEKELLCQRQ